MTKKGTKSSKAAPKAKGAVKTGSRGAFAIAKDPRRTVKQRVTALAAAPLAVCDSDARLQSTLKILRNTQEPMDVRLAALQTLQAASFAVVSFESCRADYIAALREVAQDPDPEMRQRVLGLLAREKDGFALKKLVDGLQHPEQALLPPEKALQLLGYDVHTEAYPAARAILKNPPNPAAKSGALRLLAADASSAPLFEKILRDKDELKENRQIAAAALHALHPEKLQEHAREMLMDPSEYDDIQATSLAALTNFGHASTISKDKTLMKRVERMTTGKRDKLKQSARYFLNKFSA